MKIALKYLLIGKFDLAPAFLSILEEHALIIAPIILEHIKVSKIKAHTQVLRIIIINLTPSMKLILLPIALIGKFAPIIKQLAPAIHLVVLPFPLIIATVLVVELAVAIALVLGFVALVTGACLVLLGDELAVDLGG
jgi:hypothetical protein